MKLAWLFHTLSFRVRWRFWRNTTLLFPSPTHQHVHGCMSLSNHMLQRQQLYAHFLLSFRVFSVFPRLWTWISPLLMPINANMWTSRSTRTVQKHIQCISMVKLLVARYKDDSILCMCIRHVGYLILSIGQYSLEKRQTTRTQWYQGRVCWKHRQVWDGYWMFIYASCGIKANTYSIELFYDRGRPHEFLTLSQEVAAPGELRQNTSFDFEFKRVEKQYECYNGINVRLR